MCITRNRKKVGFRKSALGKIFRVFNFNFIEIPVFEQKPKLTCKTQKSNCDSFDFLEVLKIRVDVCINK